MKNSKNMIAFAALIFGFSACSNPAGGAGSIVSGTTKLVIDFGTSNPTSGPEIYEVYIDSSLRCTFDSSDVSQSDHYGGGSPSYTVEIDVPNLTESHTVTLKETATGYDQTRTVPFGDPTVTVGSW
jgi:hypothetical protein